MTNWSGDFLRSAAAAARVESYPLVRYQDDPVRYARERLGCVLMPPQEAILVGLCDGVRGRTHARLAVRSGQKCGKTKLVIVAALWFFECFEGARVFMCAAIIEQTKAVLWREFKETLRLAKKNGAQIDGELAEAGNGAFTSSDGAREIKGVSGREIEALAGLSGNMLAIIDEASALPEGKSEAFHGNMMGGGALVMISNPTRTIGPFFDAFGKFKEFYQTFHIDSEKVARWQVETGRRIPYVANLDRINEFRGMYGEDSMFWKVRVKGEWPVHETGRCINMGTIEHAVARWEGALDVGPLTLGYDPAGDGKDGDEHVFAPVRGLKALAILRRRKLSEEAGYAAVVELLKIHRRPGETPRVLIDAEGPIGWNIFRLLRAESERRLVHEPTTYFEVFAVRSGSTKAVREKDKFVRTRDEMIWNLSRWMAEGAIPNDPKLQAECYAPVWESLADGRIQATSKKVLKAMLGRSPDSFDALALAVWKPVSWEAGIDAGAPPAAPPIADPYAAAHSRGGTMDPWAALETWRER